MRKILGLISLLFLSCAGYAQIHTGGGNSNGGGSGITITTVSGLASVPGKATGTVASVTDGSSSTDCTVGGGSTLVLCRYTGSIWGTYPAGAATAGGSNTQLQYNSSTALAGISQWTTNGTTTITGSSTSVMDLSASSATAGLKIPSAAGAAPLTDGIASFNTTSHLPVWGFNGASTATIPLTKTNPGHNFLTTYTQTSGAFGQAQPACADISDATALCNTTPAANVATFLATPSSANLFSAMTTKTGSGGSLVFATGPTIASVLLSTAAQLSYITGSTQCLHVDTSGNITGTGSDCGSGGSTAFSALTGSTNTTAAMVVGTGASLAVSGTGTIAATSVPLSGVGNPAANTALTMGTNTLNFNMTGNWGAGYGVSIVSNGSNAATGPLFQISSGASTSHDPFQACAQGTSNCLGSHQRRA